MSDPIADAPPLNEPGSLAWLRAKAEECRTNERAAAAQANAEAGAAQTFELLLALAEDKLRRDNVEFARQVGFEQGRAAEIEAAALTMRDVRKRHVPAKDK